jgi:hypothetical protein
MWVLHEIFGLTEGPFQVGYKPVEGRVQSIVFFPFSERRFRQPESPEFKHPDISIRAAQPAG